MTYFGYFDQHYGIKLYLWNKGLTNSSLALKLTYFGYFDQHYGQILQREYCYEH
jgi:hypothetical protein